MIDEEKTKTETGYSLGSNIEDLSVFELEEIVINLEAEITRLKHAIKSRDESKKAAESVFKI